jgi:hypothetical protein
MRGRGMKGFGLGQKPNSVCKRKSGLSMQVGFSLAGQKTNAKRVNLVGSITGLGLVVGFADLGPRPSTGFEADNGFSTGSDPGFGRILSALRRCRRRQSRLVSATTIKAGVSDGNHNQGWCQRQQSQSRLVSLDMRGLIRLV